MEDTRLHPLQLGKSTEAVTAVAAADVGVGSAKAAGTAADVDGCCSTNVDGTKNCQEEEHATVAAAGRRGGVVVVAAAVAVG